jgi:ribulose-5-phosphate 4-epimerase/fuculose-1-phosphate aldolase
LVIDNVFDQDLPEALWKGDEITHSIARTGKKLDALDLLPAPFPIEEILSERDRKHLKRLYGIGGLSYGNISARLDETRFWMSASGVDKSDLKEIGRDILLVKDYDAERRAMILSVPPGVEPRRVSVDAIEHWMIYREHPKVGAILHVHGWMDGIPSTEFNFPCGTYELGQAVADIVREHEDPSRAVVGLRNHGLTITGPSLDEIFDRIEGRILNVVPMS